MKLRFVLFALLCAALPVVVAAYATGELALRVTDVTEQRASVASGLLQSRLDADGARRRDMLLRLSVLSGLTQPLLDAAKAGQAPDAGVLAQVRDAVAQVEPRDPPELLAVATSQGVQVVTTSGEPRPMAVADVPLVSATLATGSGGETFARFDGALFRFTAAPVGIAEGVLLVGDKIGDSTASRLREVAKAYGVTFVAGGAPVASSLSGDERTQAAAAAAKPNQVVRAGASHLGIPGLAFLDDFFPVLCPHAASVSLSQDVGGGAKAVLTLTAGDDIVFLGRLQLFGLALFLGLLLVAALWTRAIFGPVEREARSLEAHLVRLRAEKNARLGKKGFTHPLREVAAELDRLADVWVHEAPAREARETTPTTPAAEPVRPIQRPIELPLAASPVVPEPEPAEGTPSAFPFQDDSWATKTGPIGRARDLAGAKMPAPLDPPLSPEPKPAPKIELKPELKPEVKVETRLEAKPVAKAEPRVQARAGTIVAAPTADGIVPVPLPAPNLGKGAGGADPFAAFGPTPTARADDRTREAVIPEELLARSRELEQELLDPPADPDEEHFKEVYEEFVAQRKKCGEPADGLTFDKFAARLKKNREQLVQKYNCKTVRFQVYVKEGKAAVKAAPVR